MTAKRATKAKNFMADVVVEGGLEQTSDQGASTGCKISNETIV